MNLIIIVVVIIPLIKPNIFPILLIIIRTITTTITIPRDTTPKITLNLITIITIIKTNAQNNHSATIITIIITITKGSIKLPYTILIIPCTLR